MDSFRIYRDQKFDNISVTKYNVLPIISSVTPPPNMVSGTGGAIAYDYVTKRVYYNNGSMWLPLQPGGVLPPGGSASYSIIKIGDQVVTPLTDTIVAGWTIAPSPPYHDNTGPSWNLATGVFTAAGAQTLFIDVDLSWKANVSNLGSRRLQIIYKPFAGAAIVAKDVSTQADPNTAVETTQEASTVLVLLPGDQAWITVYHDAPVNLVVAGGNHTSLCGIQMSP